MIILQGMLFLALGGMVAEAMIVIIELIFKLFAF